MSHDETGFWISPNGTEHPVHLSPCRTHEQFAKSLLLLLGRVLPLGHSAEPLLQAGWVRISGDVIQVRGMNVGKQRLIEGFLSVHAKQDEDHVELDDLSQRFSRILSVAELRLEPSFSGGE